VRAVLSLVEAVPPVLHAPLCMLGNPPNIKV